MKRLEPRNSMTHGRSTGSARDLKEGPRGYSVEILLEMRGDLAGERRSNER